MDERENSCLLQRLRSFQKLWSGIQSNLPPTYFCYGTRDPFVGEFEECVEALEGAGVSVEVNVLEGRLHGYGYREGWIPDYDEWLTGIFENN